MKDLKRKYNTDDFWKVDGNRKKALPFPGRWPTRWRITFVSNNGKKTTILSKPNVALMHYALRLAGLPGIIYLMEFDQLGVIREAARRTPAREFNIERYNLAVCSCYYPWHAFDADFFYPWRFPLWIKGLRLGRRAFFVYSPWAKMMDAGEPMLNKLRNLRSWLKKSKPWNG